MKQDPYPSTPAKTRPARDSWRYPDERTAVRIHNWFLLMAAMAAVSVAPFASGQSSVTTRLQHARIDGRTDVYARTPDALGRGVKGVRAAVDAFTRVFGQAPGLALLLTESNENFSASDSAGLRTRQMRPMRWPAQQRPVPRLLPWASGGALLLADGSGRPVVVGRYGDTAAAPALRPDDVVTSLNGEALTAGDFLAKAARLREGSPATIAILRSGTALELTFAVQPSRTPPPALPPTLIAEAMRRMPPEPTTSSTITHEVLHQLLRARHPAAAPPPWFDEGVAWLLDRTDSAVAVQRAAVRASADSLPSLAELFAAPHPATGGVAMGGPAARGGSPVMARSTPATRLFYAQSMSVVHFLMTREGTEFIVALDDGLASGATVMDIVAARAKSLPAKADSLGAEWRRWIETVAR